MKTIVTPHIRVIEEDDGRMFQTVLNRAFKELSGNEGFRYEVREKQSGHLAYIFWQETERIPETIKELAHDRGIYLKCGDCPHLVVPKDRRLKWCECPFGAVYKTDDACDWFYKEVAQGRERPIGKED